MWRTITTDDLLSAVTDPEERAYRSAVIKDGQSDPVQTAIDTAVREARAKIATCPHNKPAPGLTVPEEAIHHIIAIIRYRLLSRLPISGLLDTDARELEYKTAVAEWNRWASCKPIFEPHGGPDNQTRSTVNTPRAHFRPKQYRRRQQDGI